MRQVDALAVSQVESHLADVAGGAGGVDISFNMISVQDVQGLELTAMSIDDYMRPIEIAAVRSSSRQPPPRAS